MDKDELEEIISMGLRTSSEEPEIPDSNEPLFTETTEGGVSTFSPAFGQFKERVSSLGKDLTALGRVAIDNMFYHGDDYLRGAGEALLGDISDVPENFAQGLRNARDEDAMARDRLGWFPELAADFTGDIIGLPNKVSRALDMGKHFDKTSGIGSTAYSLFHEGKKGAVDEVIRSIMAGDDALGVAGGAGVGALSGVGGQALLGELAPRLLKYGVFNMGPASRVAGDFYNKGYERDGLTPEKIAENYDTIASQNLSVLDIAPDGTTPDAASNKLTDIVAKTVFPSRKDVPFNPTQVEEYASTLGTLQEALVDVNKERFKITADAFGIEAPESPYRRYMTSHDPEIQTSKRVYDSLGKTGVNPVTGKPHVGATSVRYKDFEDGLEKRILDATESDSIVDLPDAYQDAFNLALRAARPRVQHPNARTVQTATSGDPSGNFSRDTDVDLSTVDTNLSRLLAARKLLMRAVNPGAVIRGETDKAISAKAATDVAQIIDAQIDEVLGTSDYSEAKKVYRRYMETQDANTMGAHFYHRSTDPEFNKDFNEYRNSLDKVSRDAFDKGWAGQLLIQMRDNGIDPTLQAKIGTPEFRAERGADTSNLKVEGWEQLKAVLGSEEKAKKFIADVNDTNIKQSGMKRIEAILGQKGVDRAAIAGVVRDGDDLLVAAGLGPGQNAIYSNSAIGSIRRILSEYGPAEAEYATRLLGSRGQDTVNMLKQMRRADAFPDSVRGGQPYLFTESVMNTIFDEESAIPPSSREGLIDETRAFLDKFN